MKNFILLAIAATAFSTPVLAQETHAEHMKKVAAAHKHDMAVDRLKENKHAEARIARIDKDRAADRREAEIRAGKIRKDQLADRREAVERAHKIEKEKAADRHDAVHKDKEHAAPAKPTAH
ncbi:hypothetical protein [Flavisphingomonas formosensis]|uniref:hypothetical protein n=1 Tax=Flavisphingomonas formosensis TaxID=861534 RepID=UPI0012FA51DE|nr:hypothetical protein [Sphingomonas formosensis]